MSRGGEEWVPHQARDYQPKIDWWYVARKLIGALILFMVGLLFLAGLINTYGWANVLAPVAIVGVVWLALEWALE